MGMKKRDPWVRLWEKVDASGVCWEWTGATKQGYGHWWPVPGGSTRVHRAAWEMLVGPIPAGFTLDHRCRNKICVDPDHLEIVTDDENKRRAHVWREACAAGHLLEGENLLIYVLQGKRRRFCLACGVAGRLTLGT